jgi:anhydro-N-acetylmuramic acid kinase
MIVAGIMSGTSADGIDIAICRISPSAHNASPRLKFLAHTSHPYSSKVRTAVLAAMDAKQITTAELSQLNWRLGGLYADALEQSLAQTKLKPALIAMHGQTLYHQATASLFLGAATRSTWQTGEPAVITERLRLPVISDFRPADLAAGGQGAPLVPMLDYTLFRHATRNRILLNLGGIANFTAIPAGAASTDVLAFDTGPASMVIDALMSRLFGKRFDRNGATAARGKVLQPVLSKFDRLPFFAAAPPKSCGREEFGAAFVEKFLAACRKHSADNRDAIATATAFTAYTLREAYARFIWPHLGVRAPLARGTDLIIAGGGARNTTLMRLLTESLAPLGIRVTTTDAHGLPSEAKEAAAFALLGWLTWHHLPGNIPSATGASRPAVLGKVTYA